MKSTPDITADAARQIFSYDKDTGHLSWVGRRSNKRAGCQHSLGYRTVSVGPRDARREYKEHRLAWLLHYGEWPECQIDHINGDRSDNRIDNMRIATATQNQGNKKLQKNNTTGFKGVRYRSGRGFFSVIKCNGKATYLGSFPTKEAAHAAYCAAAENVFGEFARAS